MQTMPNLNRHMTVFFDRLYIENTFLRPIVMWLEIRVADPLTDDSMDRTAYITNNVYEALALFLYGASTNVLDRYFEEVVSNHFQFNYTVDQNNVNQFLAEKVYPNFESIFRLMSGGCLQAIRDAANMGLEPDNFFFHFPSPTEGVLVINLQSFSESECNET